MQVIYRADSIHLDLIDLAQRHAFVDTHGAPTFSDCADSTTMRPVVFTRADSVVQLTGGLWRQSGSSKTSVQFQVTTNEQDALIMYSVGSTGTSDFFGVELVQGIAALRLSLCVCVSVCLFVCLSVSVCLSVCLYVFVCVCSSYMGKRSPYNRPLSDPQVRVNPTINLNTQSATNEHRYRYCYR